MAKKLKSKKAVTKRFRVTRTGKVLYRKTGQSHFNVKQSGKQRRQKRSPKQVSRPDAKKIKRLSQ